MRVLPGLVGLEAALWAGEPLPFRRVNLCAI